MSYGVRKLFLTLALVAIVLLIYYNLLVADSINEFDRQNFKKSPIFEIPPGFEVNNYGPNVNLLLNPNRHKDINESDLKTVLMWNNVEGSRTYGFGHTRSPFYEFKCPETRCFATDDRKYLPSVDIFDAILIHHVEYKSTDMPEKRSPHQRYVFWNMEAAQWMPIRDSQNGMFNWTMTYKMNSDFPLPYGRVVRTGYHPEQGPELDRYIKQFGQQNKHLVGNRNVDPAWLVSHCDTKSNREEYVEKLQRYLNVSVYGYCGDLELECVKGDHLTCMTKLEKKHKFYLSFENAICNDYVTEKFFKVLNHDMIPIVFGGTDYSKMAPPHSYINALDFGTVKNLAGYVKMLHKDHAKFAEYFWWRDFYEVRNEQADGAQAFCDLCKALNNPNEPPKVYENLSNWWEEDSECKKLDAIAVKRGGGEIKLLEHHF